MKNFIKKIENFKCERCGEEVTGDGYTDHCPRCLWGKHVDEIIPGDRKSGCKGLMEPVGVDKVKGEDKIVYKCLKCGHKFRVRLAENDDRGVWEKVGCGE
ncbi:MAG: RNHCP domain-containing protein [Candidatus Shapirobacteria bacterium]|jgi:DNA-directed RNA polymerase subunit RPC12/RpoP